jgi:two-component sensor histidine kinase/two-component SAPR family response regulator
MTNRSKPSVLIVDDDPAKLLSYEAMLSRDSHSLIMASSGKDALSILLKVPIAVILMDVNMPDMDGFQLASLIREHPRYKETAIIFVSAVNLSEADYIRGYRMGAVDYVSVPVLPDILRAKIQLFVELYEKRRQLEEMNEVLEQKVAERTAELKRATDRQMILAREVDHRAKNSLAVASALVRLTRADSVENYVTAVEGRIGSLARAHSLISEARWEGASIRRLIDEELAHFQAQERSIKITGSDIVLEPATAQALGLAIHELATNAAKYGAFSRPNGELELSWTRDGPRISLDWKERGLTGVTIPVKAGFGSRIITLGIESQLGGDVKYDWEEDGIRCRLRFPLKPDKANGQSQKSRRADRTRSVLLVEDEPLVALLIKEAVEEMGYEVLGPYDKVADVLALAEEEEFLTAILDVNLRGEFAFPIADAIGKRSIPYLFVTGYSVDRIEEHYRPFAVLQKPIDRTTLRSTLRNCIGSIKAS